ncbi:uncharacterized protein LOC135688994 [Rhopilema esculentum]|uniref:uncharacterized protein LOC135688994 n=1 Tax=Rhopilema esculentum TaxID=499914 RepID=UPI0031D3F005|eukprot:gene7445-13209_t
MFNNSKIINYATDIAFLLTCMVLGASNDLIPEHTAVVVCLIAEAVVRTAELELLTSGHFASRRPGIMRKRGFLQFLVVVGLLYLETVQEIGADNSLEDTEKEKPGKAKCKHKEESVISGYSIAVESCFKIDRSIKLLKTKLVSSAIQCQHQCYASKECIYFAIREQRTPKGDYECNVYKKGNARRNHCDELEGWSFYRKDAYNEKGKEKNSKGKKEVR